MLPLFAWIAVAAVAALGGAVATYKRAPAARTVPLPPAAPVIDDEAARRAAILARVRRIGVAPDHLHNLQMH